MKDLTDIVVTLLLLTWGMPTPGMGVILCPGTGTSIVCGNCFETGKCVNGIYSKTRTCPNDKVCGLRSGVAGCMYADRVPGCICTAAGGLCDAYDIDLTIFCIPGGTGYSLTKGDDCSKEDPTYSCSAGRCEKNPCKNISVTGYFNEKPGCDVGYFCQRRRDLSIIQCSAGQYFNMRNYTCKNFPLDPCAGCATPNCTILSNCTKYAECTPTSHAIKACPVNTYFNPRTHRCTASRFGQCIHYEGCDFPALTTANVTSTTISTGTSTTDTTTTPKTFNDEITTNTTITNTTTTDTTTTNTTTTNTTTTDTTTTDTTTTDTTSTDTTTTYIRTTDSTTDTTTTDTTTTDTTNTGTTTTDTTTTDTTTTDTTTTSGTAIDAKTCAN